MSPPTMSQVFEVQLGSVRYHWNQVHWGIQDLDRNQNKIQALKSQTSRLNIVPTWSKYGLQKLLKIDQKTLLQLYFYLGFGSCPYPECPSLAGFNDTSHSPIRLKCLRLRGEQTYRCIDTTPLYTQIRIIFRTIIHTYIKTHL